ncbi:MAG: imidazole glycerol phosphate synthase subunit HisH [Spirochaeta sp. LUC14_002_19_P3]|nr:MAG: imidazole glycerol phosphate synthase subunit HisH [Spirochaeta sp. LUC14_002_19_P3]
MIAVVDYGAGNLTSVVNALKHLGARFRISAEAAELMAANKVIIPGVGEARQAMEFLASKSLIEPLKEFAAAGKPLLGICLGCHLLMEHSEERDTALLGLIPGRVRLFPNGEAFKVPQIGWNPVRHSGAGLFKGVPQNCSFYFANSYYIPPADSENNYPWAAGISEHSVPFAAAVNQGRIWGAQFHPEKSGKDGLRLLRNFIELED